MSHLVIGQSRTIKFFEEENSIVPKYGLAIIKHKDDKSAPWERAAKRYYFLVSYGITLKYMMVSPVHVL